MKGRKPKLVSIAGGKAGGRCPPPPGGLNEHGVAEWKRVAPILDHRTALGPERLAILEAYCRAVGLSRLYGEMMDRDGHVLPSDKGPTTHPAFKMLMGAMREARLHAVELGLTRSTATAKPKEAVNGWDADLLA